MTDKELTQLAILDTKFETFLDRYERDQKRAQDWREMFDNKLECKVIKPLYGNGEVGALQRLSEAEKNAREAKRITVWITASLFLALLGYFVK